MLILYSEALIVEKLAEKLSVLGYSVYSNFMFRGLEFDLIAVEPSGEFWRPLVHVFEVKVKAKSKIVNQIERRLKVADYIYVVIPYVLYPWILRKIGSETGIVIYKNDELYIFKPPIFIGNGHRILMNMQHHRNHV